eukprot:scaffold23283_cov39-Tisochrysis_lutea.AAC.3
MHRRAKAKAKISQESGLQRRTDTVYTTSIPPPRPFHPPFLIPILFPFPSPPSVLVNFRFRGVGPAAVRLVGVQVVQDPLGLQRLNVVIPV